MASLSTRLSTLGAEHSIFFDNLMGKVPTYFDERQKSNFQLSGKYLYKKKGYNVALHKLAIASEANEGDGDSVADLDDMNDLDDDTFAAPDNYATREELRERLRQKIAQSGITEKSQEELQKRREEKKQKKQQQKQQKLQKQKARATDQQVKKPKKDRQSNPEGQEIVQLSKSTTQQSSPSISPKKPSKTGKKSDDLSLDLSFAPVIKGYEEKSIDQAGMVLAKKGNKERQLKELQEFDEKIASLRESGNDAAADKIIRDKKLQAALLRAAGEVVKDDADKLKRSIKRKEAKKEVSRKKWGQRVREQERQQKERQDRRNLHISKKIEHKKEKKRRKD